MERGSLRPQSLDQFFGQENVVRVLKVAVESAKKRGSTVDHILFYGPPGTGKTTLSMIIANEMGSLLKVVSAPMIERKGDLVALISSLNEGDILFIDEIHRLNRSVEESIYSAMEDFRVDILTGGVRAKSISIELPRFTLIGATTRLNLVSPPLRSRFGLTCRLELYSVDEMERIALRTADFLNLRMERDALKIVASCSRGTPRVLNNIMRRIRDYATVKGWETVSSENVRFVLEELGIDSLGLNAMDRKILETIARVFKGGPVGISTLSLALNEDVDTIESVHEPYLIKLGMLIRTPRGRKITERAYRHIGIPHLPLSPL